LTDDIRRDFTVKDRLDRSLGISDVTCSKDRYDISRNRDQFKSYFIIAVYARARTGE